jgi:beta-glucosidase
MNAPLYSRIFRTIFLIFFVAISLIIVAFTSLQHQRAESTANNASFFPTVQTENRLRETSWKKRHIAIQKRMVSRISSKQGTSLLFIGDSITQGWGSNLIWQRFYSPRGAVNAGIASDRVQHILWRVKHSRIDLLRPKMVVLLAGVNNLAIDKPTVIAGGIKQIADEIKRQSPNTDILILGVFPSGHEANDPRRIKIKAVNMNLKKLADGRHVHYLDIGSRFLEADGTLKKSTMFDYLHLTSKGYRIWAQAMEPTIINILSRRIAERA